MDGTLDFDCFYLGPTLNLNNVTQTHSIFVLKTLENYFFRHTRLTHYLLTLSLVSLPGNVSALMSKITRTT